MALNQPNQFPLSPISLNTKTSTPAIAGQPSMGTIMGQRALSPLDNTKPVAQTLPQGQVQPPIQAQPKSDIQNQLDALKQTAMGLQNTLAQQPATPSAPTTPTAPQGYGVNQGLFGQLITGLANAPQTNPDVAQARQNLQNLQNEYAQQTGNIEANRGGLSLQGGQEGLLNRLFATKQAAAQEALSSALTSQQLQQQALGQAAGLAAPQLGMAGQVPYLPATGAQGNILGTQGTGLDIGSLAKQVTNGQMTIDQANSALGNNIALTGALRSAIIQQNPNFNFSLSSSSGSTQGVGQQLRAAIPPANQALDALQLAFNKLGSLSGSSIPLIQEISQNVAMQSGIGRENVSQFQGALQEARSRIDAALTGVIGVDAAGRQANALLPDNMTPKEIPGKIAAAKQYLQNQLESYTGSGQQATQENQNDPLGIR